MSTGSSELGISSLTTGISKSGMAQYEEDLKTNVLTNVETKIEDVEAVITAINGGWQGESRDRFLKDFENVRKKLIEDLKDEYKDVQNRLDELQDNYFRQDKNLYN